MPLSLMMGLVHVPPHVSLATIVRARQAAKAGDGPFTTLRAAG
jgi:hypothetical protein